MIVDGRLKKGSSSESSMGRRASSSREGVSPAHERQETQARKIRSKAVDDAIGRVSALGQPFPEPVRRDLTGF